MTVRSVRAPYAHSAESASSGGSSATVGSSNPLVRRRQRTGGVPLALREPTPREEAAFLELVADGVAPAQAATTLERSGSDFRRHARRHPLFAAGYAIALRQGGHDAPRLLERLESYREAA